MDLSVVFILFASLFQYLHGYTINADLNRITCWTCPNKGSNLECNDWAPDRFCPLDNSVCQTVHSFSQVSGRSVRVDKQCVLPEQCTRQTIGCRADEQTQTTTCVTCCTQSYCNQEVAHDNHTAISLSVTMMNSAACYRFSDWTVLSFSITFFLMF